MEAGENVSVLARERGETWDFVARRLARVRRLDRRGEGLLVRVKLACGSTKANGRVRTDSDMSRKRRKRLCPEPSERYDWTLSTPGGGHEAA
jgi:hypothetical protein